MTAIESITPEIAVQANPLINTLHPVEIKMAGEVFNTRNPLFQAMKTKIFPATEHTPKIVPYVFDEENLTRLILWAASASLPENLFKAEMKRAMYIYGPTGCGKTRLAEAFTARTGRSLFTFQCSEETTLSDMFGSWMLTGQDGMKWIYGKICQWARQPNSVLLLDEFDQLPPQIQMGLNGILDGKSFVLDQTGERITIAPGNLIVATANTNGRGSAGGNGGSATLYKGTKKMNLATQDRFNVMFETYIEESLEKDLLIDQTGVANTVAVVMASLAAKIRANFIGLNEDAGAGGMAFPFTITTRNVLNWAMNYSLLLKMKVKAEDALRLSLRMCVLDFAPKDEAAAVLSTLDNIVGKI